MSISSLVAGITQRDMNYYDHLQADEVRQGICNTIRAFWEDEIRGDFTGGNDCKCISISCKFRENNT